VGWPENEASTFGQVDKTNASGSKLGSELQIKLARQQLC